MFSIFLKHRAFANSSQAAGLFFVTALYAFSILSFSSEAANERLMVVAPNAGRRAAVQADAAPDALRIRPYDANPFYWQYKGRPVLLLGGSWQDNLFNHPEGLEQHLDLLVSVGGNYVRNTMSHRDITNIFPYGRDKDGLFDLKHFNEAYWERFEHFLKLTHDRDIIVQIELFDPHDYYMDRGGNGGWSRHPFNPKNNVNYTPEESGLPTKVTYHVAPHPSHHPFFETVPALRNNEAVLAYQNAFVDKLLAHSLKYPHVLYTIDNEIGELNAWGDYWAVHVRERAKQEGLSAYTADMRRDHNILANDHRHIYDRPELYTFLDISQVTGSKGQSHYDDIMFVRNYIANNPRPVNSVKNYGSVKHGEDESVARFYRMIFAGGASTRFHRPHPLEGPDDHLSATQWGLGLSQRAQVAIKAMREVEKTFNFFRAQPRNDLLSEREPNEAYLVAALGEQYAVYFPAGGSVALDLTAVRGEMSVRRVDVETAEVRDEGTISGGGLVTVTAPGGALKPGMPKENLIINGSFEADAPGASPGYTNSIHGWSLGAAMGHIINDASGPFYTPALGPMPEGGQIYGRQDAGLLSQKVSRLQHGQPFELSFKVNCREDNEGMTLAVKIGGHVVWSDFVAPAPAFRQVKREGVYDASWGKHLSFEFTNPKGDSTLMLDDVQLWSTPGLSEHCVVVFSTAKNP